MQQQRTIGLAVNQTFSHERNILRAIVDYADIRFNWNFIFLNPELDRNAHQSLRHVDATVLAVRDRETYDSLPKGVFVVDVSDLAQNVHCPRVANDNAVVGEMAAQHFLERGLRSFGFVNQCRYRFSIDRAASMRRKLEAAGYQLAIFDFSADDNQISPMSYQCFPIPGLAEWLSDLPRPAGVLVPCDHWAVETLQICQELGLRVPEDIAVLGVDNDDFFCRIARPALSSIVLSTKAIGCRTAQLIASHLDNGHKRRQVEEILIPPEGIVTRRYTDVLAIDDPDVVAAIRFIRENHSRAINVSDVLKQVPVSRRWLERRVREAIGVTLGEEIRRVRMECAKRLLTETTHSIADVAKHSGFTDIRHIENTFRAHLALSPSEFRQRAIGSPKPISFPSDLPTR